MVVAAPVGGASDDSAKKMDQLNKGYARLRSYPDCQRLMEECGIESAENLLEELPDAHGTKLVRVFVRVSANLACPTLTLSPAPPRRSKKVCLRARYKTS